MDLARNNFSTLVYGNGGGRRPATCVYATIVSWPAGGGHNVRMRNIRGLRCASRKFRNS